jgi:hypothetical protein
MSASTVVDRNAQPLRRVDRRRIDLGRDGVAEPEGPEESADVTALHPVGKAS